jgi:hypothetical protein
MSGAVISSGGASRHAEALVWTELPDKSGITMTQHRGQWSDLLKRLSNPGHYPLKGSQFQ